MREVLVNEAAETARPICTTAAAPRSGPAARASARAMAAASPPALAERLEPLWTDLFTVFPVSDLAILQRCAPALGSAHGLSDAQLLGGICGLGPAALGDDLAAALEPVKRRLDDVDARKRAHAEALARRARESVETTEPPERPEPDAARAFTSSLHQKKKKRKKRGGGGGASQPAEPVWRPRSRDGARLRRSPSYGEPRDRRSPSYGEPRDGDRLRRSPSYGEYRRSPSPSAQRPRRRDDRDKGGGGLFGADRGAKSTSGLPPIGRGKPDPRDVYARARPGRR